MSSTGMPNSKHCARKLSIADISGYNAGCSTSAATDVFVRCLSGSNLNVPEVGLDSPVSKRISVVLPAPFFPTKPTIEPCSMERETLFTAIIEPYFFEREMVSTTMFDITVLRFVFVTQFSLALFQTKLIKIQRAAICPKQNLLIV